MSNADAEQAKKLVRRKPLQAYYARERRIIEKHQLVEKIADLWRIKSPRRIDPEDLYGPIAHVLRHKTPLFQEQGKRYRIERDKLITSLLRELNLTMKVPRGRRENVYALAAVAQLSDLYARFHLGVRRKYTHVPDSNKDRGPFLEAVRLVFEAVGLHLASSGYARLISSALTYRSAGKGR